MKDNIETMNTNTQRDDFKAQWQRRQQWQEQAEKSAPNDETLLQWVKKAQQISAVSGLNVIPFPTPHRKRWIPYAAAASLIIGVAAIGLNRHAEVDETIIPVAQEVDVDGNTMFFLCNNGCSVQEVMLAANDVIKK